MAGGRRSFEAFGESGGEHPIGRKRRRRMTLRGRLTHVLPIGAVVAAGWLAAGPGRTALALAARWLEPPAELRLARVEAPPPELPWAPDSVLARLPVSQEAFRLAQASADWLPKVLPPGARLWESLAAPPERPDLVTPLRVEYTLNPALTERVFDVLEQGHVDLGHVIVMDPATDEILVYASTDLERFPPTATYPAASLIKVVTTAATLEHSPGAVARPCRFDGSPYRLTASRVNPPRRGTEVSLTKALATSNNQCFAQLAVHEVGATSLLDVIRRFGILEAPGPMHAAGSAEDPGQDPFALGQLGCGLAGCRITPLQAARMASVVADGQLDHPRWISRVVDGSGRDLPLPDLGEPRRVLSPKLAATMREMMVETTVRGTARRAFNPRGRPLVPGVRIAGKTGSLSGRDPDGRYEWFIGVAPAEKPRIAVAVVVVQGSVWHRTAAQVSAGVFHTLFCDDRGACGSDGVSRWLPTADPQPSLPPVRAAAATGAAH